MSSVSEHAKVSPSASDRWLNCPPSVEKELRVGDTRSEASDEGTLAHGLSELQLKAYFRLDGFDPKNVKKPLTALQKSKHYDKTMQSHVDAYVTFVIQKFNGIKKRTPDAVIIIEKKIDLRNWIPEGFGTGDVVIIADGIAYLIDLKYGKGVFVEATENSQLSIYGLGLHDEYNFTFGIKDVEITIYQPRMDNISSWAISATGLLVWGETKVKTAALLAFNGKGDFKAGEHCGFCKFANQCQAKADYELEVLKHDFRDPDALSLEDIAEIIGRAKDIKTWLGKVEAFALQQALAGKEIPDYKLVEGRSTRIIPDVNLPDIQKVLKSCGLKKADMFVEKFQTIGHFEKLLGKSVFNEKVGGYLLKPPGAPTLVPLDDKREAWSPDNGAAEDFAHLFKPDEE